MADNPEVNEDPESMEVSDADSGLLDVQDGDAVDVDNDEAAALLASDDEISGKEEEKSENKVDDKAKEKMFDSEKARDVEMDEEKVEEAEDVKDAKVDEDVEPTPSTSSSSSKVAVSEEEDVVVEEVKAKKKPEVVELSSDEEEEEEEEESSEDDEVGDPSKPPGEGADRNIDADHLLPFHHGWRREVVMRQKTKNSATTCDIFYIPPADSGYRTRESKRKRSSKMDQEQYFQDFPHKVLSIQNFNYVKRPLGLSNAAYEIIRKPRGVGLEDSEEEQPKARRGKSYKEVEESEDLLSESEDEESECDQEVEMINGLSLRLPISLQMRNNIPGLRAERKRRRKRRDPETCCTPPLAEDMLWTALDDDSLGVYTDLGGRSSPTTPPPLRAVKLTFSTTGDKILKGFEEVRKAAADSKEVSITGPDVNIDHLASHDVKIREFKHVRAVSYRAAFASKHLLHQNSTYSQLQQNNKLLQQELKSQFSRHSPNKSNIMGPVFERMKNLKGISLSRQPMTTMQQPQPQMQGLIQACSVRCPGASRRPPSMQCISCRMLYHAKCQGVSQHVRVFKCRNCLSGRTNQIGREVTGSVRMKLPMPAVNGKRPVVEIVMFQNNVYRPIKFSNNMTVTEVIPKRIFHQANTLKKTIYLRAKQVPRVGTKPLYLAVNPSPAPQTRPQPQTQSPITPRSPSDQVSILVRKSNASPSSKPVLLNVPRKVAVKVKKGTTLSFSASDDQKYVVVDNRIHPPLKSKNPAASAATAAATASHSSRPSVGRMQPSAPPPRNQVRGLNIPVNLPGGLSIQRTTASSSSASLGYPRGKLASPISNNIRQQNISKMVPGGNVLSSGEVVAGSQSMTPCTPYCPGVTGFPELECKGCKSLFHGKCVGVPSGALNRIQQNWMCKMCIQMSYGTSGAARKTTSVQVIDLD